MANSVEGILNIDKPVGLTSHDVVQQIRRVSGIRRVGHTGTLDPLATGLLIICVGRATRLAEYLSSQTKSYLATIRLGQETSTYDAESPILTEVPVTLSESELLAALEQFRGPTSQIPPMFSAIKQNGQPLYKLARAGSELERPPRDVTVYNLQLLAWEKPDVQLYIECSAGTYIRSIAHDLGQLLGCGGHITALRRTAIGSFAVEDSIPLTELNEESWADYLRPSDTAVNHLPILRLSNAEAMKLHYGQPLEQRSGHPDAALVRAYDDQKEFVGIVTNKDDQWRAKKIFYQPSSE